MPEDVAIALRKSEVDTCTDDRDIDRPKSADRQTDGQTAFQLYIVDSIVNYINDSIYYHHIAQHYQAKRLYCERKYYCTRIQTILNLIRNLLGRFIDVPS